VAWEGGEVLVPVQAPLQPVKVERCRGGKGVRWGGGWWLSRGGGLAGGGVDAGWIGGDVARADDGDAEGLMVGLDRDEARRDVGVSVQRQPARTAAAGGARSAPTSEHAVRRRFGGEGHLGPTEEVGAGLPTNDIDACGGAGDVPGSAPRHVDREGVEARPGHAHVDGARDVDEAVAGVLARAGAGPRAEAGAGAPLGLVGERDAEWALVRNATRFPALDDIGAVGDLEPSLAIASKVEPQCVGSEAGLDAGARPGLPTTGRGERRTRPVPRDRHAAGIGQGPQLDDVVLGDVEGAMVAAFEVMVWCDDPTATRGGHLDAHVPRRNRLRGWGLALAEPGTARAQDRHERDGTEDAERAPEARCA
jgi:hypothetical protein